MSSLKPKVNASEILIKLLQVEKVNRDLGLIDKYYNKFKEEAEADAIEREKAIRKEEIKKLKEEEKEAVKKAKEEEKEIVRKAKEVIAIAKEAIKIAKEKKKENVRKAMEDRENSIKIVIERKKKPTEEGKSGSGSKKNKKLDENAEKKFVILTKYNIFVREYQKRIMELYPGIDNKDRMAKIAIEWEKHKAIIAKLNSEYEVLSVISSLTSLTSLSTD